MNMKKREKAMRYFQEKLEFTLGPAELMHRFTDHDDVRVLDVRAEEDYRKGHIPGAISVPKDRWDMYMGLSTTGRNVVYCYSQPCHLAAEACLHFAAKGFHMMELEGGMEGWRQFGYEVEGGVTGVANAA
jgi:rhodanese-related sulfurtransferase